MGEFLDFNPPKDNPRKDVKSVGYLFFWGKMGGLIGVKGLMEDGVNSYRWTVKKWA